MEDNQNQSDQKIITKDQTLINDEQLITNNSTSTSTSSTTPPISATPTLSSSSSSLSEKRKPILIPIDKSTSTTPIPLKIDLSNLSSNLNPIVGLKQGSIPRSAGAPSNNATALSESTASNTITRESSTPTPNLNIPSNSSSLSNTPNLNLKIGNPSTSINNSSNLSTSPPSMSASSSSSRVGRSGTLTKKPTKRTPSKQPFRRDSQAGYEGGLERHGQANDFVDEDEDDSDDSIKAPTGTQPVRPLSGNTRPKLNTSQSQQTSSNNLTSEDIRNALPNFTSSTTSSSSHHSHNSHHNTAHHQHNPHQRNHNPSSSSHQHGRLPLQSRPAYTGSQRTSSASSRRNSRVGHSSNASATSTRSAEANAHPFPTPGMKAKDTEGLFHSWKSVEENRLDEDEKKEKHWRRWGPYISERQWATVREDYSANGDAWTHFPHEHARSRAYRWGEDGLGGICDNHGRMAFALGLWNGKDPILKERMFGVTGHQGNHGEDVKELYYYLDSTPTHSYMKYLYKYPQREYPYEQLVRESNNRGRDVGEFEITDTDAFDDDRYWDIFVEYAKDEDNAEGISIRITAYNRGPDPATLHIIPQLWFRNTWSWPKDRPTGVHMPSLKQVSEGVVQADQEHLGRYYLHANSSPAPVSSEAQRRTRKSTTRRSSSMDSSSTTDSNVLETDSEEEDDDEPLLVDEIVIPELMFTENDTNFERLYGGINVTPYVKDAFHDHIIPSHRPVVTPKPDQQHQQPNFYSTLREHKSNGDNSSNSSGADYDSDDSDATNRDARSTPTQSSTPPRQFINPEKKGTKAGAHYEFKNVPGNGGCCVVRLKLTNKTVEEDPSIQDEESFDCVIEERRMDSDEFYSRFNSGALSDDLRNIMRQALSGMLWTKQFYMFIQKEWIEGDPGQPPPPPGRKWIRNNDWKHLHIEDVLSMPDKWEYPFFAIWDSAFHAIPLAMVDPAYAKKQLDIMTREWYMKPDGALPAYEWNFSDVNPPVHAWAAFRVFKLERKMHGREDLHFLERVFQKLLINFTWWVNRKDETGNNIFEGGFLGLDNISPFNRSEKLPTGGTMKQSDGTSWVAFYCLSMLNIALELAKHNSVYEDIASKFFEHFLFISDAMSFEDGVSLWNDEEGFYFDAISWGPGQVKEIPIRSLVGLIPLYATLTLEPHTIKRLPGFKKRMEWFIENRSSISKRNIANMSLGGKGDRRLLALANEDRLRRILERMLDEEEFLSDYGIRSLSRYHKENPWSMDVNGEEFSVHYWPGDSQSGMFGGNSNWRGPIWLATTFLLIESLQRFYQYHGSNFKIECPTGSGDMMNLAKVADEIQHRIIHIFARDHEGNRACNGGSEMLNKDPNFRDYVPFHEFFHADNGKGLGASHQTGWTGLVAFFIWQTGSSARLPRTPRTPRSAAAHYFDEIQIPPTPGGSEWEYDTSASTPAWGELSDGDISPADL